MRLLVFFAVLGLPGIHGTAAAKPDMELARSVFDPRTIGPAVESPIPGVFQFSQGKDVFYISEDGRYVMQGEMIDLKNQRNVTESFRASERLKVLSRLSEQQMIRFAPPTVKFRVSVFIDAECPYCRLIQQNMDEYNKRGIAVRYLAFPRSGLHSPAAEKLEKIWCSDNPAATLLAAEHEQSLPALQHPCSIVQKQYAAGLLMGIVGTPAIILEDGTLIPGFVAPENLEAILVEHFGSR